MAGATPVQLGGVIAALAMIVLIAACSPSQPDTAKPTTSADKSSESTTTAPPPGLTEDTPAGEPQEPPSVEDASDIAAQELIPTDGYIVTDEPGLFERDALTAINAWLPADSLRGTADAVYTAADGGHVAVVSIIPTMELRGDPAVVPVLAGLSADDLPDESNPGVFRSVTDSGLIVYLWSTGDGFLVAASLTEDEAETYLSVREDLRTPRAVWKTGDCLYMDPADGLPWAPMVLETVVPCNGSHNAEVFLSSQTATDAVEFDEGAIQYQRGYDCDRAYTDEIGPQKDHKPSLITYMPDADEWDRGDRYLACVVQLDTEDGPSLFAGLLSERNDLQWTPVVGDCFAQSLPPEPTDCSGPHVYQLIGETTTTENNWPIDAEGTFDEACAPFLEETTAAEADVDVFALGPYPYVFEMGDRTVRCMAFATTDGLIATVIGSFFDDWRALGRGGIAT